MLDVLRNTPNWHLQQKERLGNFGDPIIERIATHLDFILTPMCLSALANVTRNRLRKRSRATRRLAGLLGQKLS